MNDPGVRRLAEDLGEDFSVSGIAVDNERIGYVGVDVEDKGQMSDLEARIAVLNAMNRAVKAAEVRAKSGANKERYMAGLITPDAQVARLRVAGEEFQLSQGSGLVFVDPVDAAPGFKPTKS